MDIDIMDDQFKEQYTTLYAYVDELLRSNPGSIMKITAQAFQV